jgi:eukaryotic-like serine/threonine-protein kinase
MDRRARYEAKVGATIPGGWKLLRLLGWGSTSAVYEAVRPKGTRPERAAIKILHASLCANPDVVKRFLREAYVPNTVPHRSIVEVLDDGVTENSAFLALELLEGETLEERRLREGGKLALEVVAPLVDELLSALITVHATRIVHRDLKPQNVFLTTDGAVKLLDFGTARIFDVDDGSDPISVEGLVIGTPSFMSPEQARGEREQIDAKSDLWSLGATLFTTLSGEYVHHGRDAHQRLLACATKPPRSFASVAPSIAPAIAAVIDRALVFDKAVRWPDARAMRAAFRSAAIGAGALPFDVPPSDRRIP